ncbi:restriction endonuclease subunit S [Kitasatospora sp. NPDC058046]|uniref:restriction endonuclease subunit S n=1 Tax=Kitasatospora sp. NPDC058046 TaxID=3346312 RepID=UPI0036DAE5CC
MNSLTLIGAHRAVSELLGNLPESWDVVRFKGLFDRLDRRNVDLTYEMLSLRSTGEVVRRADMGGRQEPDEASLPKYLVAEIDDLVVNPMWLIGGGIGVSRRAGAVSPDYRVFRSRGAMLPRFVHHLLRSQPYLDQYLLYTRAQTTFDRRVQQPDLDNLPLPVPPLEDQSAIADYLDRETARIDTLIEEQQILIGLLTERRVAVMAIPFSQAHPTAPLGSVLEELIDHRGKTPGKVGDRTDDFTDQGVPVVSAIHIKNGHISWAERERFVPYWMFEKWMPVRLRAGDVLLTSEAPLGNVAQVPADAPLVLSQRLFALRGREDILDSTYLRFFLESDQGQALLRDGASGSTVAGIRQSRLVQVPVPIPPVDEQRRVTQQIREQITKIDTLMAETERFVELSKERRAALITAAVTGQIDIREVA